MPEPWRDEEPCMQRLLVSILVLALTACDAALGALDGATTGSSASRPEGWESLEDESAAEILGTFTALAMRHVQG